MSQTAAQSEQGTHFYILTLQQQVGSAMAFGTVSGTHTPPAGWTVNDFCRALRAQMERDRPELRGGVAVHFDVRPNQL
ncbi:hypothetical protein [Kitasatospora griseola]|uniref:hypothetical protein n=1 Tax=Kitasatospora griseola TaxID=2064 RepID=UPI00167101FE|nr:hypothetical protein [Kitasatospora griseola]GGR04283.1 hypothetical protein GCM10010195_69710 [Kitasatospora griseola]